jgi:hypothetical protein
VDGHRVHRLDGVEAARRVVAEPLRPRDPGPQPAVGRPHHGTGLAVVDLQGVVVAGHQQRAADVPLGLERELELVHEPLLDLPVPVAYAVRPLAVRAEQPVVVEGRHRRLVVAGLGGPPHGQRRTEGVGAQDGSGVVGLDELDLSRAVAQRGQHRVGVAHPQRLREGLDVLGGAEVLGECDDR